MGDGFKGQKTQPNEKTRTIGLFAVKEIRQSYTVLIQYQRMADRQMGGQTEGIRQSVLFIALDGVRHRTTCTAGRSVSL